MTDSDPGDTGKHSVKENMSERKTWVRLIYMVAMAVAWNIGVLVFWAVTILQFLTRLFTGDTNPNLRRLGRQLAEFFGQTARFETFDTETVPFPFTAWPSGDEKAAPVPATASRPVTRTARAKPKGPARLRTRNSAKSKTPDEPKPIENDGPAADDKKPRGGGEETR